MKEQIVTKQSLLSMINSATEQKKAQIIGRALVGLFKRQTEDERAVNDTNVLNLRGFCSSDARRGSIGAKYFIKHGTLLDWQINYWLDCNRRGVARIVKYSKQLNEIALERKQSKA